MLNGPSTVAQTPGVGTPTKEDMAMMENLLDDDGHALYRKIVGRVQYLCNDRDDLLYAVKECAKDLAKPSEYSMKKIKQVKQILKKTFNKLISFYTYDI